MPKFAYTALDSSSTEIQGLERADTAGGLRTALLDRGLQPIDVTEKKHLWGLELTKKKVKKKDLMHFSRQLAVFVRAGIPILEGLETISEETGSKALRIALEDIAESLRGGARFADAAASHPEAFPVFYISVLRSAELTGHLDLVLDQLADYIDRELEAKSKVMSALFYPAIVAIMAVVTVFVLTIFVLPRFEVFFESLDAKLPLATRILLGISAFVGQWWWAMIAGFALFLSGAIGARRTTRGRVFYDRLLLKLPGLGGVLQHAILERFCRILASMVTAGVPLPDALGVTANATNNSVYKTGLLEAREAMMRGEGLAKPLNDSGLFPGAARQMLRVGEETGTLDDQLTTAAKYYDRELDYKIKKFTAMFEPMVIIFMGLVVGFVAIAMVSAMYGIFNQVDT